VIKIAAIFLGLLESIKIKIFITPDLVLLVTGSNKFYSYDVNWIFLNLGDSIICFLVT
jgi:hypothetical protein